jgi:hypothetical protein
VDVHAIKSRTEGGHGLCPPSLSAYERSEIGT